MKDVSNSVKQVMVVYIVCFIALITYIAYFQVFTAPKMAEEAGNPRIAIIKNEVLRGTIYDKDGNALTTSARVDSTTQSRTYTQGDLFAHVLGYSSNIYGVKGLEATYDEELSSYSKLSNNFNSLVNDFSMDKLKSLFESRKSDEEKIGNGIVTTLDTALQKVAYNALGDRKGAVVALNPQTGEILAMVSKPTYNANNLASEMAAANKVVANGSGNSPFINRVTLGMYPPGSTFKIVTATSALQNISGVENRTFLDDGKITFQDGSTLNNAGNAVYGNVDLKAAFKDSSNDVFGGLALELGNSKLKATAESFGFNNSIDGNGVLVENSSFPTLSSVEEGNIAQSGIGQSSILATPMQMAVVASTIANNGKMMELSLVSKIVDKDKQVVKTFEPKVKKQVIDASIAATVKDYMTNLVNSKGWSEFQGINAAGKTGTADYNDPVTGKEQTPHSWFVGFAPANNPQIAVAVIVENGGFGSKSAAPVAGIVMSAAVK